jgi:hypothetical protein
VAVVGRDIGDLAPAQHGEQRALAPGQRPPMEPTTIV